MAKKRDDLMNDPAFAEVVPVGQRLIDKPDLPSEGMLRTHAAEVETVPGKGQLKMGRARQFTIFCDEPSRIGGNDEFPNPLAYLNMAVGF